MSLFDKDLITSEPTFIKDCREWMMRAINKVVHDYISDVIDNTPDTWYPMNYILSNVRFIFIDDMWDLERIISVSGMSLAGTDTTIDVCHDGEHEYVIKVGMRLVDEKNMEKYINIIKAPIFSTHEKELVNIYRKEYNYEPI